MPEDCILTDPTNADIVRQTLEHRDGEQYLLLAWAIMPNHVHAMIEQVTGYSLSLVVQARKSVSAHRINKARGSRDRVWARDYFDRFVRDEQHFANSKYYIENNPVKAGLVQKPERWSYSSAALRTD